MRVKLKEINKELLVNGIITSCMLRANEKSMKRMHLLFLKQKSKNIKGLDSDEKYIKSRDKNTDIRVRVFKPMNITGRLPGVLYLHGGGYILGIPEMDRTLIKDLIDKRACVVVAPDYRLSGEAPYPAALNDCYDTLLWMKKNSESLGINNDQLVVYGNSAGGGLTAATCLYARDDKRVNIAFQMPLYPMIDDRMNTESMIDNNALSWNERHTRLAWDKYLSKVNRANTPIYASPARADDLSNLPPAFTIVGSVDPFRDETISYIKKLRKAGVAAEYKIFQNCYHGFEIISQDAKISIEAQNYILDKFAYGIDNCFAKQFD